MSLVIILFYSELLTCEIEVSISYFYYSMMSFERDEFQIQKLQLRFTEEKPTTQLLINILIGCPPIHACRKVKDK